MKGILIKEGSIFGKGVYAARDFTKGDIVIQYNLKPLSEEDFVHTHWGIKYLYSIPERYVNHSLNSNTLPDLKNKCDVAIKDIKTGEEITTDATKDEI